MTSLMSRTPNAILLVLMSGFIGTPLFGQADLYVVASGRPKFGFLPVINGNLVVWQRYPDRAVDPFGRGWIQCRDITNLDSPVVNITEFSAGIGGLFLSKEFLFWGEANSANGGAPVMARRRSELLGGSDLLVSVFGRVVGTTADFVIIKGTKWEFD